MIHGAERQVGTPNRNAFFTEERECLRCRDFVNQVQIDIQNRRRIGGLVLDEMIGPDFLK